MIISQNDNALGVFSLTETAIALNDDDQSSVMVSISRTGGQLEGVSVCCKLHPMEHDLSSSQFMLRLLSLIHQSLLLHVAINHVLV